ncbi:hypothetical protein [Massilia sp. MB5]|nr:hypothetical protein [Massilia sp. MB5]
MGDMKNTIREFFARFFQIEGLADNDDIFAGGYVNSFLPCN